MFRSITTTQRWALFISAALFVICISSNFMSSYSMSGDPIPADHGSSLTSPEGIASAHIPANGPSNGSTLSPESPTEAPVAESRCRRVFPSEQISKQDVLPYTSLQLFTGKESPWAGDESVMRDRMSHLEGVCDQHRSYRNQSSVARFLNFPLTGVLYCAVAKCANTYWSTALNNAEHRERKVSRFAQGMAAAATAHLMRHQSMPAVVDWSNTVNYSVIPLRHPVNRFLSAFNDIFLEKGHAEFRTIVNGLKHSRGNKSDIELFARWALDSSDRHFWSYLESCNPCDVRYTHIIDIESSQEVDTFLSTVPRLRALPEQVKHARMNHRAHKKQVTWQHALSGMSPETFISILRKYEPDFRLFGYKLYKCS